MSAKVRVVFFGTPEFALPTLKACFEHAELLAVVCQPDRPRGRGHKVSPCETRAFAIEKKIPSYAPPSLKKDSPEKQELLAFLRQNPADLFVVVAYGNLFPQEFLDMAKFGAVNVHASLLPRWRGAAPIQRSLEHGDAETGVALQKMLLALDAGDVLIEKKLRLGVEDAPELSAKLSALGAEAVRELFQYIEKNAALPAGQAQDPGQITFADKIKKEEGFFRQGWTAMDCLRKIRAFRAWPQVKGRIEGLGEVKLLRAAPTSLRSSLTAGSFYLENTKAYLVCADETVLEIESLQVPGKAPANAYSVLQNLELSYGQKGLRVLEILESENKAS